MFIKNAIRIVYSRTGRPLRTIFQRSVATLECWQFSWRYLQSAQAISVEMFLGLSVAVIGFTFRCNMKMLLLISIIEILSTYTVALGANIATSGHTK